MSKRVVIAGAGGFGRGVLAWIKTSPRHLRDFDIDDIVFIDDGPADPSIGATLVDTIADFVPGRHDVLLCAIGSPEVRRRIVEHLTARGAEFHSFVDDRAVLAPGVSIGDGVIVSPGTVVSVDARLGAHAHLNFNCSIGHDTTVGAFCTLSPGVNVMGQVELGDGAFLGGGAVVLPRLQVRQRAVVGAGAVVIAGVDEGVTVVGNPARVVRRTEVEAK